MPGSASSTAEVDGITAEDRTTIAPTKEDYDDDDDCLSCRTDGTTVKASNPRRRRITIRSSSGFQVDAPENNSNDDGDGAVPHPPAAPNAHAAAAAAAAPKQVQQQQQQQQPVWGSERQFLQVMVRISTVIRAACHPNTHMGMEAVKVLIHNLCYELNVKGRLSERKLIQLFDILELPEPFPNLAPELLAAFRRAFADHTDAVRTCLARLVALIDENAPPLAPSIVQRSNGAPEDAPSDLSNGSSKAYHHRSEDHSGASPRHKARWASYDCFLHETAAAAAAATVRDAPQEPHRGTAADAASPTAAAAETSDTLQQQQQHRDVDSGENAMRAAGLEAPAATNDTQQPQPQQPLENAIRASAPVSTVPTNTDAQPQPQQEGAENADTVALQAAGRKRKSQPGSNDSKSGDTEAKRGKNL